MTSDRDASGDSDADEITLSVDELDALVEAKVDERLAKAEVDAGDSAPSDAEPTDTASTDDTGGLSRRGLLGLLGSGAAGFGLASVTDSAAGDSAGALDGRDVASDFEVANLQTQTIDTEVLNTTVLNAQRFDGVRYASEFSGKNGGEMIQHAIDDLPSSGGVVVVGAEGPDDGRLVSNTSRANIWSYTTPPELGDDTTLLLQDSHLAVRDGSNSPIIRNANANSGDTTRNSNIQIIGIGNPILNGNGSHQNDTRGQEKYRNGIRFYKTDNTVVSNVTIREPNGYCEGLQDVTQHRSIRVEYDCKEGGVPNQDGIHIIRPAKDVVAFGGRGSTDDDCYAIDVRENIDSNGVRGTDPGPVEGVKIIDFNIRNNNESRGLLIFGNQPCRHIRLSEGRFSHTNPAVNINNLSSSRDIFRNFVFSDLVVDNSFIFENGPSSNVIIEGCVMTDSIHMIQMKSSYIENLTIDSCRTAPAHSSGKGGLLDVGGGEIENCLVDNSTLNCARHDETGDIPLVRIDENTVIESELIIENCRLKGANGGINSRNGITIESGVTFNGLVRIKNFQYRNVSEPYNIPPNSRFTINSHGQEAAGSGNKPTASRWRIGDVIKNVDDGTIWYLPRNRAWIQIA